MKTYTSYNHNVDFTQFKTYAYMQEGLDSLPVQKDIKDKILENIDIIMNEKKFQKVSEGKEDILINLRARVEKNYTYNSYQDYPYYGRAGYYARNRYPTGDGVTTYVRSFLEGTFVIDMIDKKNNDLLWQSTTKKINAEYINSNAEAIPKIIRKMLRRFPPKN